MSYAYWIHEQFLNSFKRGVLLIMFTNKLAKKNTLPNYLAYKPGHRH